MTNTIYDLLKQLQPEDDVNLAKLANTRETWERIANKDSFSELGLSGSALDSFLKDWISENPYSNI